MKTASVHKNCTTISAAHTGKPDIGPVGNRTPVSENPIQDLILIDAYFRPCLNITRPGRILNRNG